ncbi:hypothetical protein CGSSa03_05469 [Staphylococcus aureus subsp. aureus CGS03]|nr:hypothetical protein CGSSa03_05469 [Staphylococcus aureus subsp. aureus CGS03]
MTILRLENQFNHGKFIMFIVLHFQINEKHKWFNV